jgi:hypothetical protein
MVPPDSNTTKALYAAMSPQIVQLGPPNGPVWGAPCDVLDHLLQDVVFTVGSAETSSTWCRTSGT